MGRNKTAVCINAQNSFAVTAESLLTIIYKQLLDNYCIDINCSLEVPESEIGDTIQDNIIYVNYNFLDGDFIDLVNKEKYKCGVYKLENEKNISTFIKSKEDKVSDFKLYLIKNKNKFKISLNEILELI